MNINLFDELIRSSVKTSLSVFSIWLAGNYTRRKRFMDEPEKIIEEFLGDTLPKDTVPKESHEKGHTWEDNNEEKKHD